MRPSRLCDLGSNWTDLGRKLYTGALRRRSRQNHRDQAMAGEPLRERLFTLILNALAFLLLVAFALSVIHWRN